MIEAEKTLASLHVFPSPSQLLTLYKDHIRLCTEYSSHQHSLSPRFPPSFPSSARPHLVERDRGGRVEVVPANQSGRQTVGPGVVIVAVIIACHSTAAASTAATTASCAATARKRGGGGGSSVGGGDGRGGPSLSVEASAGRGGEARHVVQAAIILHQAAIQTWWGGRDCEAEVMMP
ncbi:hypothetical protein E2C01_031349 [Portunus trituberculatus]|uniref:Uncharacterized protein n=1 Tax=Portunus trituberculatus TaxID=210409 RepID=A0A5B7EZU7_PORTR|nr:hypothetical protein [Portunus trituberculatus]